MKKCFTIALILSFLIVPVSAMEFTAPTAPESAEVYMPDEQETFGEGLWYILKTAMSTLRPELANASKMCSSLVVAVMLLCILNHFSERTVQNIRVVGAVIIGLLLLQPANTMIRLGANTVEEVSNYGKLLLPVMTSALAAQGGTTSSIALYGGTIFFNSVLTTIISRFIIPAIYIFLCICLINSALEQDMLKKLRTFVKGVMTWGLKTILYVFTGYISITRVISGAVDASALKATKLAISGVVPVVGGILSDATETILVSAGVMKSAAGVYGVLAIIAICLGPFVKIGVQYLLLKLICAVCNVFGYKPAVGLVEDFSTAMGLVLAMTGTVCVMLLVSIVCFMKGIGG